jgi:DNA repair exonuclease SbcCD ATPase subunit
MFAKGDRNDVQVDNLRDELKVVFSKIKEEFEDHLESINQNTIEIQSAFEYLSRIASSVEKIEQRLARLENRSSERDTTVETVLLTRDEEEVYALLLDSTRQRQLLTYEHIARRIDVTKTFCAHLIANLVDKGVPIIKRFSNGDVFLEIDPRFADGEPMINIATID